MRARFDLAQLTSRMRCTQDEDWQSRVAELPHTPFAMQYHGLDREVTELNLLPLRDGSWTSTTSGPVYGPKVEGTGSDISIADSSKMRQSWISTSEMTTLTEQRNS